MRCPEPRRRDVPRDDGTGALTEPSVYFQQHHVLEAPRIDARVFQPFWRVARPRTRLDRLFADGAISLAVWRSASRFRAAVEHLTGNRRGVDHQSARGSGGGERGLSAIMRLSAFAHVRRVQAALGRFATALVWSCVVDNSSWAEVGARLGVDPKTARSWTIAALQALAAMEVKLCAGE